MTAGDSKGNYERLPTEEPADLSLPIKKSTEREGAEHHDDHGDDFNVHKHNQDSCFRFVEASWFQVLSACVIVFNTITVFLEADDDSWEATLFWPDQSTLCFYIFELFCRICFFGKLFLCGPVTLLFWNVLDLIVVSAGIIDQWVLPFFPLDKDSPLFAVIMIFRMLRLVRVMKIIRVFLETDLSWTEKPPFQSFVGGVIGFNALLMGMETDIKWWGWFYIEQVLLVIYVFELLVRLKRFGFFFMSCYNPDITWNLLDFCIVVSSAADSWLMPMIKILGKQFTSPPKGGASKKAKGMKLSQVMMLMRMLRLMRILRLVKLVKSVRPLYILVTGVLAAFQGVAWVLVLTLVVLYAAGILATRLLGHGLLFPPHVPIPEGVKVFATVPDSMFTLFRVMSGAESDDEAQAIDSLMAALPTIKFAFIFFMVTSSWTLLSILTAVVSDNMITTTGQQAEELKIASDEEDRQEHKKELRSLFESSDKEGKQWFPEGYVAEENMKKFLKDKDNALKTAKCCGVATRNVTAVLHSLVARDDSERVKMEDFVNCMLDVGKPVTLQSIMKIETKFADARRKVENGCDMLVEKISSCRNLKRNGKLDAAEDTEIEATINALVKQQRRNREGIGKLHESVQALLKSQEALRQQNAFNKERKAKLEAGLCALDQRNGEAFATLIENVAALRTDLNSVSKMPDSMLDEAVSREFTLDARAEIYDRSAFATLHSASSSATDGISPSATDRGTARFASDNIASLPATDRGAIPSATDNIVDNYVYDTVESEVDDVVDNVADKAVDNADNAVDNVADNTVNNVADNTAPSTMENAGPSSVVENAASIRSASAPASVRPVGGPRPEVSPARAALDEDLRRLLALRGEAKLCSLPGNQAQSESARLPASGSVDGRRTAMPALRPDFPVAATNGHTLGDAVAANFGKRSSAKSAQRRGDGSRGADARDRKECGQG